MKTNIVNKKVMIISFMFAIFITLFSSGQLYAKSYSSLNGKSSISVFNNKSYAIDFRRAKDRIVRNLPADVIRYTGGPGEEYKDFLLYTR